MQTHLQAFVAPAQQVGYRPLDRSNEPSFFGDRPVAVCPLRELQPSRTRGITANRRQTRRGKRWTRRCRVRVRSQGSAQLMSGPEARETSGTGAAGKAVGPVARRCRQIRLRSWNIARDLPDMSKCLWRDRVCRRPPGNGAGYCAWGCFRYFGDVSRGGPATGLPGRSSWSRPPSPKPPRPKHSAFGAAGSTRSANWSTRRTS